MPGIGLRSLAVALPRWRLEGATWSAAWGRSTPQRGRAVAGPDEDSLTLASDAAAAVLGPGGLGGLLVATTTAPCAERSTAAVLAVALRLDATVYAADLGGTLRAGTTALVLGATLARAGDEVVVSAADRRDAEPGSDLEPLLGDAGAAVRLGSPDDGALAVLVATGVHSGDLPDTWRVATDVDVRRTDPAFAPRHTLPGAVAAAAGRALAAAKVAPREVAHFASGNPDRRTLALAVSRLGLGPSALDAAERAAAAVGFAGTAAPLVALAAALDVASPGDLILCVGYGSGAADALLWRVGEAVRDWQAAGGSRLEAAVAAATPLPSYARFLRLRGRLPWECPEPYASMPLLAREQVQDLALTGTVCSACGRVSYPMRRVCDGCGGRELAPRPLAKTGRLVTWTEDHLVPNPEPPTIMAVADLSGGGRFYGRLGAALGEARPGLEVELVLRRLHEAGNYPHYFWAMRPHRVPGDSAAEERPLPPRAGGIR